MKIQWNRVTWYSKAAAVVLFVGTFALAFWLGVQWDQAYKGGLAAGGITESDSPRPTDRIQYVAPNLLLGPNSDAATGNFVVGFNGQPVYTYAKGVNCTGQCAAEWIPYTIAPADKAAALTAIEAPLTGAAGTVAWGDGSLQVTYDGKPLYFYAGDKPGSAPKGVSSSWSLVSYVSPAHPAEPAITKQGTGTVAINKPASIGGVLIAVTGLEQDSRCPAGVYCIQAGTVSVSATVNGSENQFVFTLGKTQTVGSSVITLTGVAPEKNSKVTIAPSDYRFTFSVVAK